MKMTGNHALIQNIFSGGGGSFRPGVIQQILPLPKPVFWKIEGGRSLRDMHSPGWSSFLRNPTLGN